MCLPTHPRVFVRFGKTKGEIRVEKGDFRGGLGGFWGSRNQPPHPPAFGRDLTRKTFFWTSSLNLVIEVPYQPDNLVFHNHKVHVHQMKPQAFELYAVFSPLQSKLSVITAVGVLFICFYLAKTEITLLSRDVSDIYYFWFLKCWKSFMYNKFLPKGEQASPLGKERGGSPFHPHRPHLLVQGGKTTTNSIFNAWSQTICDRAASGLVILVQPQRFIHSVSTKFNPWGLTCQSFLVFWYCVS